MEDIPEAMAASDIPEVMVDMEAMVVIPEVMVAMEVMAAMEAMADILVVLGFLDFLAKCCIQTCR